MAKVKLAKDVIAAFLVGILLVFALRLALYNPRLTHYHANFALYINGTQDKFDNFTFYEEVKTCDVHSESDPHGRAHMHGNVNNVIHVHAEGVTWGHFFANLGYGLNNKSVMTDAGTFVDGAGENKLTFILNGEKVSSVANRLINSEDVLLISFGNEGMAQIEERFKAIPKDAGVYNSKVDPASCSGTQSVNFKDRLKRAFDLTR